MSEQAPVDPSASSASTEQSSSEQEKQKKAGPSFERGFRFWMIIATLCVIGILSALENTVVTTSLPHIVTELNMGGNYIWVTNVFFLTSAAVQPLFGQLANIFGRRWITLVIVSLFTLGSGICGGAHNGAMLIAGCAVQGMGSGGINMIVDVIVSDLVPLRERGNYMAFVLLVYFVGTALGLWIGGAIVDNSTWRWIRRINYIGNAILIATTVSVLFALTYGGTKYDWSLWHILVFLILGLVGLLIFVALENSPWICEPVVPPRLFGNRTSATVFAATFLNSALLYWVMFFLPVYFQAVLGASAERSGVQVLPIIVVAVPAAIVAVLLLAKFGRYKPLHLIGFAVCTIGLGLFTLFDRNSTTAEWVIFQMIAGGGSGFVLNTLLPACQAGLAESDQAAATAAWSFVRSFGNIWGVAIPAAIFNNRFEQLSGRIPDAQVRELLSRGRAYESASASFIQSFSPALRDDIVGVYADALKRVWQISIVFSGVSFLLVFLEKEIKLRTELETEYGLEEKKAEQVDVEQAK
ncbi:MFS general substrate transporter [Aspergillus japonicus CBS 114.51]|uniref:MFS general substrate transporter n=1 Tax=Aspergillus japonicus CBS 114.51 TaxID=1448312 RepID=A0A8T8WLJ5_ASPJA|nr:MFS general substrate transporter [Aspergillus japonicus CBS 114.51]RAH76708.1 MFS general substrate transporter [Aspergillus japonicus CBS 114.51]